MNVTPFPIMQFKVQQNGYMSQEWTYFFSMNNQEQQRFFSQDGHLVPTRTSDELNTLSTTQYTARFAYNGTTENHMANVAGTYKNLTMNNLTTRSDIVAATPMPNRIEQYGDENKNLYTNVNGTTYQNLTVSLDYPVQFSTDGTNLFVDINGVTKQVTLT